MLLDMAPGSQAPAASFQHRCRLTAALLLIICVALTKSAPTTYDEIEAKQTDLAEYLNDPNGCYYNYQHYEEGDRIVTNEPCLNCTCHNRMLMCYLRVCPFSKAIGQDCTVQKTPDQCCPTISCPEVGSDVTVPVHLLTSSTTQPTTTTTTTTTIGWHDSSYGCLMDENEFFPDGAQVPIDPWKPCELCYCIRNRTACVIQECTLHVEGCRPVYHDGVCCPVRYDCDYEIEKSTTTTPQISGGLVFSTTSAPSDCRVNDEVYTDGESIAMNSDKPCEHCYCMRGDIVCVVQDCGEPLRGKDCTPETPPAGQCCPNSYQCANETTTDSYSITTLRPASQSDTDEHETQKYPSQNDAFNKLGEKLPGSELDGTNDIPDSEHIYTTPAATNDEILPVGISDQTSDTNEETSDSATGSPDAVAEGTTGLPTSDSTNKINGQNQQDVSVAKPDSPNSINPVSGTESDLTKVASTDKPVESTSSVDGVQQTQSPAADPSVNENAVSPTASTTSDENNAVPANDGNGQNESPVEDPSQDDIASNSPVITTENDAVESETQSSNIQGKPQEETQQQTDAPSAIEKEPTKSSNNEQTPALNSDVKPQSEITSDKIQEPPKESDVDSTESLNKIQTNVPSNDDVEQTTQQLTQQGTENTPLGETNAQTNKPTNIVQDSPNKNDQFTTQTSQNDNSVTESSSNAGPNAQNNDNSQEGNVSPTEIPKVGNEPAEQNQLPVDNKPIAENQPEAENTSTEQNQDSSQIENASQTEIPNAQNEPTEQNKIQEESKPHIENKPESENIPAEQNQDSPQAENVSPTKLPSAENQNKLQEENVSPTGLPGLENQDGTQEANVSPTDVPKVENESTEQNKPIVEFDPQTENQPEKTPAEQNQDSTQGENVSPTEFPKVEDLNKPQAESASPTEIPKVENESTEQNKPLVSDNSQTGNQPESDATATEPNSQDNLHSENKFSTEIPKVENEPVEQNKPLPAEGVQGSENKPESENKPVEQNQDSPQVENASSTDIPKVENEPTEQIKPLVDAVTEQNKQDSPQSQNVSPTEIPKVENDNAEQNKPTVEDHKPQAENKPESENTSTENINQDSPQLENESPTDIPKVENEPTEQNKPSTENGSPVTESQSEWNKTPTEPNNQDSPQVENVSPTDKPKVENEPVEQNKLTPVESGSQSEDKPESQNTPTEKNEESPQIDIVSPTNIPKVEDGPAEQNKPPVESPQSPNQPESQNTPTEKNQDSPQAENVSPTEIPKVENEPAEQNKPLVDSNPQAESQPESQKEPAVHNQNSAQVENVSPTDIPTKLSEPQSENVSPINQDTPVVSENDVPTEQPISDNNIFTVTSTSPPLTSQNQVKDKEPIPAVNKNTNSETEKIEDKVTEKPQPTADDKISSVENVNKDNVSPAVSSAEIAPENNNVSPQTNDENAEHSTETKPIENEVVNAGVSDNVTNNPVSSHEKVPEGDEHHDNSVNSEPSPSPTTETNNDFNSEITNGNVLVDDSSVQDNEQTAGEEDGAPNADSDDHQIDHHTETPTEMVSSTIDDSPSVNEHVNDVSTSSPQQQLADNNIPVQPAVVSPNEPVKTQEETKIPSGSPENGEPEKSPNSHVPTEISEIQNSDELSKATELPTLNTENGEQSVLNRIPETTNENENTTSHEPSLEENINEILDQTTVYPTNPSSDKNNLNGAAGLNQNNQDSVTPLLDKVETSTNAQSSGDEPIKNINQNVPSDDESSTLSQLDQVNQGSSENVGSVENAVTTNNYADVPSVVQSTNAPASQENNKGSLEPIVQSDKIENNANNNQPENVKPQQNLDSDDTSTQYNVVDSSTGIPIHESSSVNVNNNIEASTNAPVNSEIPNEINQDSVTESELYATESPTEKPILAVDSNKTPANDATMEAISNLPEKPTESQTNTNEITNESTSKSPQDPNEPFVTKPADYVIDITASSSESSNKVIFESIKPEDHGNEVTTSNIDKNDDATTELYENVQPGVPGEGSCLIDFVTYPHKANVPKSNPCHEKCECLNSIVTCTSVNCPPAPPQHRNCIPLHPGNESWCCPTYMCEGGIEGMIFENHNNDGAPQLISTVVLEDKPGEENNENTPINEEVPTTSSPQIALEYNTLAPSQDDTNSQDASGATEVPAQTEIPIKLIDDTVVSNGENIVPTTIANLETVEKEKPIEHDKPVENDKLTENDKPEESEQPSENETPVESDKPEGNEKPLVDVKPVESDQLTENEKPIDDSEADVTTVTYAADGQTVTNRPETSNNAEEQNVVLPNTVNESQDIAAPSTDIPNDFESTIASVIPANDQKLPEENTDSDDTVAATTYKPEDSVVDQQVDDIKTNGAIQPTNNGEAGVTNLPPSDVNPVEATEIPTIVADTKPTVTGNNENGLRPTSIDDIINSVNMVKDAVKNSLETSSKPAEIDYQTTVGAVEDYQPTEIVPEQPDGSPSSSENPLPVELPQQTTANGAALDVASELPTNAAVDEKLPESPVPATESAPSDDTAEVTVPNTSIQSQSDDTAGVTVPSTSNQSPSAVDSDQQGAVQTTDIPSQVLDTQEIATGPSPVIANRPEDPIVDDGNRPEEPAVDDGNRPEDPAVDDGINRPEVTTAQYSPSAAIQDSTASVPVPQSNAEQSTNVPGPVKVDDNDDDDKSPEISTASPAASAGPSFTDDTAPEKPDAETPVSIDSDDADNKTPATQVAEHTTNDDKRFGVPSSSPSPSQINHGHDDNNNRPQESEEMMHIPLDTETSSPKPSPIVNTPVAPYSTNRPSYTPIPQSTWTQKPFHQDSSSTSEAPQQPDQGFPDEYDDENEAVYGPGTCRYGGKIYVSAQQVPRDDPCDFCFCFRGDIICLQQSCPPPIFGCYQENIQGFCCPRYECPVAQATSVNVTTTTTTTTTMVPPHFFANAYRGAARRTGCLIHGHAYRVGEDVGIASGPCLECICGADGKMACDPKPCSPEPLIRKMMAAEAMDQRRR